MRRPSIFCLTLFLGAVAVFGETTPQDSQVTQALLTEIRQLRLDLQATAATVQRVQLVMYRAQIEASQLSRAVDRLDNARVRCNQAQSQRKMAAAQIEQVETRRRSSQHPLDQKAAEELLHNLKLAVDMSAEEERQCKIEEGEAETQFRAGQAKMNELQDQLDNLDRGLAAYGRK